MVKEITLPEVSENIDKGEVVKVLVKVGDQIEVDQPVIELETDKAMFEVPSTEAGVVKEIKVKEGDSVNIGGVILTIDTNGKGSDKKKEKSKPKKEEAKVEKKEEKREEKETEEKEETSKPEKKEKESEKEKPEKEEKEEKDDEEKEKSDKVEEKTGKDEKAEKDKDSSKEKKLAAPASPSVRRFARELGVDIHDVSGSGTGGRISEDDVKKFVKSILEGSPSQTGTVRQKKLPDFSKWGETNTEKMSNVRKITAESMTYAWTTIPHVTQFDNADITSMEEFRKKHGKKIEKEGGKLTITSILLKICAEALKEFPQFNSSIDLSKNEIIYKKYFNIGIAVDTERGLLVPVIKDVNKKNLTEISVELTELSEKARNKKITPEEMEGGNFTITNLGGIGGTNFTPIVYSPQVAILAVSRAEMQQVYREGNFSARLIAPLALSYDHRIIDGADAARFLRWICEALEYPLLEQL